MQIIVICDPCSSHLYWKFLWSKMFIESLLFIIFTLALLSLSDILQIIAGVYIGLVELQYTIHKVYKLIL